MDKFKAYFLRAMVGIAIPLGILAAVAIIFMFVTQGEDGITFLLIKSGICVPVCILVSVIAPLVHWTIWSSDDKK